jgi:uncharacterized protein involved in exopolysaccharide biosynthesis
MKRILKWLARLYPPSWRNRYGAEYEALLDDATPRPRDAFDVLWSALKMQMTSWNFVRIVLPCALASGLLAMAISFAVPVLYTSGAMVVVQSFPLVPGATARSAATADGESQGSEIRDLVVETFADREAMAGIIRKYNLYPAERAKMPMDSVVDKMRSAIFIRAASRSSIDKEFRQLEARTPWRDPQLMERSKETVSSAFTVEFEYPDPHVAQMVDATLLSMLVRANLRLGESAAAGHPRPPENIWLMNAPSLPQVPSSPKRGPFAAGGLLAGLVGGVVVATVAGRRRLTFTNG